MEQTVGRNGAFAWRQGGYYALLLVVVYACFYSLALVTGIEDVEFMGVDERSIMTSLHGLYSGPLYNMTEQYHSKAYGWTYFSVNFVAIAPLKLLGVESDWSYNLLVRSVQFLIGIGVTLLFYLIARGVFSSLISFAVALIFLSNYTAAHYFVTIHPETTGMLFYLAGLYVLFRFFETKENHLKLYVLGLTFFWLSALSKQSFAVTSAVTMLLFPAHYLIYKQMSIAAWLRKPSTWGLALLSVVVVIVVLFVINPYAIIDFSGFVEGQMGPLSHSSGRSLEEAVVLWADRIKETPLVIFHAVLILILPFYKRLNLHPLFIFSFMASWSVALLFMYMQKLIISMTYLYPLYPVFIINIVYGLKKILSLLAGSNKKSAVAFVLVFGVLTVPIITLEAMQAGKPIITLCDSGGPLEFIRDGEEGRVIPPKPAVLAEAMTELTEDVRLAERLGQASQKRYDAMNISWETVVERLVVEGST